MNWVSLKTSWTNVDTLYSDAETPRTLIGVPKFNPWETSVVTVILLDAVVPFPEKIFVILIGSDLNDPTISHSGALFAKDVVDCGNLDAFSISL